MKLAFKIDMTEKVKKKSIFFNVLLIMLFSLNSLYGQETSEAEYPRYIGDIIVNKETDKDDFELCNEKHIYQYFNNLGGFEYYGGKSAVEKEYYEKYKSTTIKNETGLIRINFVVNCKGETDRFRLISMDEDYNEKTFAKSITEQLMSISKSLKGWMPKKLNGIYIDYYQYLIFKIEEGRIKEILP